MTRSYQISWPILFSTKLAFLFFKYIYLNCSKFSYSTLFYRSAYIFNWLLLWLSLEQWSSSLVISWIVNWFRLYFYLRCSLKLIWCFRIDWCKIEGIVLKFHISFIIKMPFYCWSIRWYVSLIVISWCLFSTWFFFNYTTFIIHLL